MITIKSLRYRKIAIDALSIKPGITTIIGPNGSGKTTFLKLCAGIAVPETGTIMIDNSSPRETDIGWVNEFPDRNILFVNVIDEIASSLRFRHVSCNEIDVSVRVSAEAMGITHLLNRRMHELSGGEKALVSLAAALIHRPKMLVLDEYDSHLDNRWAGMIEQAMRSSGADYVLRCTQQMNTAIQSDQILFFDSGQILHQGTPTQVFPLLRETAYYPIFFGS
jgi:energy-coupling factor transport system ATP-binding protein